MTRPPTSPENTPGHQDGPARGTSLPTEATEAGPVEAPTAVTESLLTLDELCARVGMSVRNVRFYTTRGLVPPPLKRGRSGYYSTQHVARLELVNELQSHGFTLAAIDTYVSSIPEQASPEDIALHRAMLAPWAADLPVEMTREELSEKLGRGVQEADLNSLAALGIVHPLVPGGDRYRVATSQLGIGRTLLDLGFPTEAAVAAGQVYARHGQQMATELNEIFRTMVWPTYRENPSAEGAEKLQRIVERLKPLSIASLVNAYEAAIDEQARDRINERGGRDEA